MKGSNLNGIGVQRVFKDKNSIDDKGASHQKEKGG
jgi:hypothetical protein